MSACNAPRGWLVPSAHGKRSPSMRKRGPGTGASPVARRTRVPVSFPAAIERGKLTVPKTIGFRITMAMAGLTCVAGCGRSGSTADTKASVAFRSDVQNACYYLALALDRADGGATVLQVVSGLTADQRAQVLYTTGGAALHVRAETEYWRHPDEHPDAVAVYCTYADSSGASHLVYRKFGGALADWSDTPPRMPAGTFITAKDIGAQNGASTRRGG